MKITTKLAWEYFKKNKKRNTGIIVGIAVVTVLITTVLILMSSYQEYMVNSARKEGDWEARFSNITYGEAMEIAKDENIKEISISHKIGTTEENFIKWSGNYKQTFNLRAYDKNALKNANINVVAGRLPENSKEIIISLETPSEDKFTEKFSIGSKLKFTIKGQKYEYTIVGRTEDMQFDHSSFAGAESGMITILEEEDLNEKLIVDAEIKVKDIKQIYKITNKHAEKLAIPIKKETKKPDLISSIFKTIYDKFKNKSDITIEGTDTKTEQAEEEKNDEILAYFNDKMNNKKDNNSILEYNTKLLNYAGVLEADIEFSSKLVLISSILIIFIMGISIIMLYTAFKLNYSKRIKELGMLSSLGMNRKQRKNMIKKEALILGAIRNYYRDFDGINPIKHHSSYNKQFVKIIYS